MASPLLVGGALDIRSGSAAGFNGLPVSTTHVSVGSLLSMGVVTRQAKWKPVMGALASWFVTFPCAAILAAAVYWALR